MKKKEMSDEEKICEMCKLFNSMMPERLHIGKLPPKWIPEHPPRDTGCDEDCDFCKEEKKQQNLCEYCQEEITPKKGKKK